MRRSFLTAIAGAALLSAVACASTTFNSTWRDPEAEPVSLVGKRVAAFFVSKNMAPRRAAEAALVRELNARGAQGIAGHTIVSAEVIQDESKVKAILDEKGIDGMILMRVTERDRQTSYTPGYWTTQPYYRRTWNGYWRYGWGSVYTPGYLQTDNVVSVETLVFSARQDKLLWAGMSDTVNPSRADAFVAELAQGVVSEMKKAGLLVP